jgi:hypothetical protein
LLPSCAKNHQLLSFYPRANDVILKLLSDFHDN